MPGNASTLTARHKIHGAKVKLLIWWDQLSMMYYKLVKPSETIKTEQCQTQLMGLSRALKEKRPQCQERHEKVILQHDNARLHVARLVKTYLETLKWEVLPHQPYSSNIFPSDYHLAHGLAYQNFCSYEEIKKWSDSWVDSKVASFLLNGIWQLPERWKKDNTLNHK